MHIDVKSLPQLAAEDRLIRAAFAAALRPRSALTFFVAIDRATRLGSSGSSLPRRPPPKPAGFSAISRKRRP